MGGEKRQDVMVYEGRVESKAIIQSLGSRLATRVGETEAQRHHPPSRPLDERGLGIVGGRNRFTGQSRN
jgi:hypothetical protein